MCVALVGQFLHEWSFLEYEMEQAIGAALGLSSIQRLMITKNMQLRDKINLLKTVAYMASSEKERSNRAKMLSAIADFAGNRNMIAHDLFLPSKDGRGVNFLVTKARGRLAIEDPVWTASDFFDKFEKISSFKKFVKGLRGDLETFRAVTQRLKDKEASAEPTLAQALLVLSGPQPRQPQETPLIHPDATSQKVSKTRRKPPRK